MKWFTKLLWLAVALETLYALAAAALVLWLIDVTARAFQ